MVLWDCAPTLGLDEEDPTEEIQLSSVNVTTRRKGPVMDEILILPKISKIQESVRKHNSNTRTPPKSVLVIRKYNFTTISKPVKVLESKAENNKKSPT